MPSYQESGYQTPISQQKSILATHFAAHLAASKGMSLCYEMALVCQTWFRSCEIPCGMKLWLRKRVFSRFVASQPIRSFEMGAPVLRSGTCVPNFGFAVTKIFAEESNELRNDFAKDGHFRRDMLISQRLLLSCEMVSQRSANFAKAAKSRRGCEISQTPVFTLFSLCFWFDFSPTSSFQFLCIFSHLRSFKKIKLHIKTYFKIKN